MAKKHISSKEAYFKRPDNITLEEWEKFKEANPRPNYVGEQCWSLHDSMILRGKPGSDKAIVKLLLKELNIQFVPDTDELLITSDLTDKDILVVEIEDDELLEQLEAAGARVLYITSNPNYGHQTPERYFAMYPEKTHNINDYPAIDKRNLFKNKNIIVEYIDFYNYKNNQYLTLLYNILGRYTMKIDKTLMNPPYDVNLHLSILDSTLKAVRKNNPNCELVSVQPARWLEDPLAELKERETDYIKYKNTIINKISKLQLIKMKDACNAFNIGINGDLAIYTFNNSNNNIKVYSDLATSIITKILNKLKTMHTLKSNFLPMEQDKVDGYRLRVNPVTGQAAKNGDDITATQTPIRWCVFDKLYKDGFNVETGKFWTDERKKSGNYKPDGSPLPFSIKLPDLPEFELLNCAKSYGTNFIWNWLYLIKLDQNTPLKFIPYMEDYSHIWTDEDYCEFFDLDKEEAKFMCRTVEDYRVKDFINYITLED